MTYQLNNQLTKNNKLIKQVTKSDYFVKQKTIDKANWK